MSLERIEFGQGHWYKLDGTKADGVTTLIKKGLPSPALMYWSARTVAEYVADQADEVDGMREVMSRDELVRHLKGVPWAQRNAAAVKGTKVHAIAEKLAHGHEVDIPEELRGHVESCARFLDDYQLTNVLTEVPVGNRQWRYAGTADLFAVSDHTDMAVWDFKTAASGVWPETALQLAAYRHAEIYLHDGQVHPLADLNVTEGFAVWLRADGYDVIPVDTSERVYKCFLHIAYTARHATGDAAKEWLEPAIQLEDAS